MCRAQGKGASRNVRARVGVLNLRCFPVNWVEPKDFRPDKNLMILSDVRHQIVRFELIGLLGSP